MKLLFENWRKYLKEEQEGEGMLLYHATPWPAENFSKGIDAGRAKGFGQGAGFYLFTNKDRALKHAHSQNSESAASKEESGPGGSKYKYLVVVDEPVTPENFDIDYEVFAQGFAKFIENNWEYFVKNDYQLGIGRGPGRGTAERGGEKIIIPNKKILGTSVGRAIGLTRAQQEANVGDGEILSAIAQKLAEVDPGAFRKFEEEMLSKATAVKYNGEKTIYPLQIEDLEGNVVWNR